MEKITRYRINKREAAIRRNGGLDTVIEKMLDSDGNLTFRYCSLSAEQKAAVGKLDAVDAHGIQLSLLWVAKVEKDGIDPDAQLC